MATVDALVAALRTGDDAAKEAAAKEVWQTSSTDGSGMDELNGRAFAEVGGIELLIDLVRDGSAGAKAEAAYALAYMSGFLGIGATACTACRREVDCKCAEACGRPEDSTRLERWCGCKR